MISPDAQSCSSKRIAFVLPSLKFGGGERVALNLAMALNAEGYEIDFLLMSYEGEFLAEAQRQFKVVDLKCNRTWKLPFRLWHYLQKTHPTVLISSFWKLNLCACLSRAFFPSLKLLVWEHSPPTRSSPAWLYAITASVFYRLATCVVGVSSGVAADVLHNTMGLGSRVATIFNPIPPPIFDRSRLKQNMGRRIIWVGRLDDPKNPGLMLEAFALLPKSGGYTLCFVGDGGQRVALEERAHDLGLAKSARFIGFQQDTYAHMADADLLVLSSDREGLPTVLIEAMHVGLRAVSTDCGEGIHDILRGNRYGTIVPINDEKLLAMAIETELSAPSNPALQIAGAQSFVPSVIARQFMQAIGE